MNFQIDRYQFLSDQEILVFWTDQHRSLYSAHQLRLACPCAACIDEWTRKKILQDGSIPKDVRILRENKVGRYALQFHFSDGHGTGIYKEEYLRSLCTCNLCQVITSKPFPPEPPCREWVQ